MATPTDGPTMDTSGVVSLEPIMETSGIVVSCVPMVPRCCPRDGGLSTDFKITSAFGEIVDNAKVNVDKLYLRQIFAGGDANQSDVIEPNAVTGLGRTGVNHWGVYDGLGSTAKLVANGHGMHTHAGKWSNWFTLVFVVERFKGSTLQVMGANDDNEENEWAIVGGTGKFAMARGIIKRRVHSFIGNTITQELTIEFFCRMKEVVVPPSPEIPVHPKIPTRTKRGPWGGNGGSLKDMEGKSQCLESLTIYHHGVVEGFQFSYIDEDGQIRTTGTWGQNRNLWKNEINFGPSEYVKEISGAGSFDGSYLCQLKIVTNNSTYGPFGTRPGTPFSTAVPKNEIVVGFFGSHDNPGNNWVKTIGVYTITTYPEMPAPPKMPAPMIHARTKRGPWGGNGGSLKDMEGKSQRLESLTIYHHGVVEGFQFSYIDEDGQIRTTGTWGQNRNLWKNEMKFGPSEYVKEISGAGSSNGSYLCQLKIVTNNSTYGPFGTWLGTPFSTTVPENETVVGFFGSSDNPGNNWVKTIGVYTVAK